MDRSVRILLDLVLQIRQYIHTQSGLIDKEQLVSQRIEDDDYIEAALNIMKANKEIKIITKHFCPETHYLCTCLENNKIWCQECDYLYSLDAINAKTYIVKNSAIA